MGRPLGVLALRAFRYPCFCLSALFIAGWCRATDVPSAEGENYSLMTNKDPGSQDRGRWHPKAPPPPRDDAIPLNSTRVNLELEQGEWSVTIENNATNSEVRALMRRISEEGGESSPMAAAVLSGKFIAIKHGYQRTVYWFEETGVSDVFDEYLANLAMSAADRPVNVLEIGSFEGASALWIAEHLLLHPDSMLLCIDLWTGGPDMEHLHHIDSSGSEDRFRSNMARVPNGERVTAVKGDSLLSLSSLIAAGGTSTFDVVYVDGGHTMQSVLADAVLSFRLLKVGGLLIFDDMNFLGVERATAAIIEALGGGNWLEVLHNENQMVARKTTEDPWITPASVVTTGKRAGNLLLSNFAAQPTIAYNMALPRDRGGMLPLGFE